jgi:hypothetical protein
MVDNVNNQKPAQVANAARETLKHAPLIPAKAGIQGNKRRSSRLWVPAFAGTSGDEE